MSGMPSSCLNWDIRDGSDLRDTLVPRRLNGTGGRSSPDPGRHIDGADVVSTLGRIERDIRRSSHPVEVDPRHPREEMLAS